MKNQTKHLQRLLFLVTTMLISGCTITVIHKFDDRYYQNPGNQFLKEVPGVPESGIGNMVETSDIGAGYDIVYMNPDDLSNNSVQNNSFDKPQVFLFEPDPSNFIDIIQVGRENDYRRNLPKGVDGSKLAGFKQSDNKRWTRTASEYQNSFDFKISGGGGVKDVAKFTGSTAFKNIQKNTRNSEHMYLHKDGYYEGHTLSMDMTYPHQLNPSFKRAIESLTATNDAVAYRAFITNWGTHFSQGAKFGAKCSYKFTFTKDGFSNSSESENSFGIKAEGGFEAVSFEFGLDMAIGQKSEIQKESGAQNLEFISHGGSGAKDFEQWSNDAMVNRAPIDAQLESYEALLIPKFFPEMDASILAEKRELLEAAIQQYFKDNEYSGSADYTEFYKRSKVKFRATVLQMEMTAVSSSNEKDATWWADKNNEIYGVLGLIAWDSKSNTNISPAITVFDLDNEHFIKADEGAIIAFEDGKIVDWNDGTSTTIHSIIEFEVDPTVVETGYVSLLVNLKEKEALIAYTAFPQKDIYSPDNRVRLEDASSDNKDITLFNADGDILTFRIRLERL